MILLDTHALVWTVAEPGQLSRPALAAIRRARSEDGVAVASITLWELALLIDRGRIQGSGSIEASVSLLIEGVAIKQLTPQIAALAVEFPDDYPRDPADRLTGATARAERIALVTRNQEIRRSSLLKTIW